MAQSVCEVLWLEIIIEDLKIKWVGPIRFYYEKKFEIRISHKLLGL